ncbi:MAG: hypothetical protein R3Y05_06545 [bacterium]
MLKAVRINNLNELKMVLDIMDNQELKDVMDLDDLKGVLVGFDGTWCYECLYNDGEVEFTEEGMVVDYQVYVNNYTTYSVEHLQEAKHLTRATEWTLDDLNSVYDWNGTCSDIISDNLNTLEEARNELKSYENKYELEGNSRVLKQTYFINKDIFDIDGEIINSEIIESGDSHIHTFLEGDK